MESSVKQMAELLNLAAAPYANMGGLPVLQDFLGGMLDINRGNGLVYLLVLSERGETLVTAGKIPTPLPEPDAQVRDAVPRGLVHVRNPLLLRGNRVGSLQFGISTQHVLETQMVILREGLLISGGIAILVMLGVFGIGLAVSRRIDRLIAASQQIAHGNYNAVRPDESGRDEISLLASNFNLMATAISSQIKEVEASRHKVEQLNATLENMVTLRTEQINEKNAELASTIDNLTKTQESLVHSEKLAGLGAIVAGVAHELNSPIGNALTVSTTQTENTRVFLEEMESGLKRSTLRQYTESSRQAADIIQRNLMRAAELVQSFKQVAVDQSSDQKRPFCLVESVQEYLLILQPTLKKTPYRIEIDLPADLEMNSYPGPLGQVFINLLNNSILHGFDGRAWGVIRIKAEPIHPGWLRLTYSDDGHGIPPENIDRVFDPFFTTRLGQGGSGLGLNIVFNIVTRLLGGSINVHSAAGEGTTFVILLPQEAPAERLT